MIPEPIYPEYRLTLVWRADEDGHGIRAYLSKEGREVQSSFHPTLNLCEAVEAALSNYCKAHCKAHV